MKQAVRGMMELHVARCPHSINLAQPQAAMESSLGMPVLEISSFHLNIAVSAGAALLLYMQTEKVFYTKRH